MAKHVPTLSSLRRLLPYYRPYRVSVASGLVLVAASAAFSSVVPWFLRRALDGIRNHDPLRSIWLLAGAMVLASLIGGVGADAAYVVDQVARRCDALVEA